MTTPAPPKPRQPSLFESISTVPEKVQARVNAALLVCTEEQTRVLEVIVAASASSAGKLTQRQIADACPGLGAHHRELEAGAASDSSTETTLRRVRQIVHDLRVVRRVPILSDPSGYWLPRTEDEVAEYVNRVGKQARATAEAWLTTVQSLEGFLDEATFESAARGFFIAREKP